MNRLKAFEQLCKEYQYGKLVKSFKECEFDACVAFIEDHATDSYDAFEQAANRWHLDVKIKPKHWSAMQEVVSAANTRAAREESDNE